MKFSKPVNSLLGTVSLSLLAAPALAAPPVMPDPPVGSPVTTVKPPARLTVFLLADGKGDALQVPEGAIVVQVLQQGKVKLSPQDLVTAPKQSKVTEGQFLQVTRMTYKLTTTAMPLAALKRATQAAAVTCATGVKQKTLAPAKAGLVKTTLFTVFADGFKNSATVVKVEKVAPKPPVVAKCVAPKPRPVVKPAPVPSATAAPASQVPTSSASTSSSTKGGLYRCGEKGEGGLEQDAGPCSEDHRHKDGLDEGRRHSGERLGRH